MSGTRPNITIAKGGAMMNDLRSTGNAMKRMTGQVFGSRKRLFTLLVLTLLGVCWLGLYRFAAVQAAEVLPISSPLKASLSDRVLIHGKASGALKLSDGRELFSAFAGNPQARQALMSGEARPLSLAAADFDEDGVADLIAGYAGAGGGIISLHRGNVDALYPNSAEARQRKQAGLLTSAPFLSPAQAFQLPQPPDFFGAGDFNADGHWDIVAASRNGQALYLLRGSGDGGFELTQPIALSGTVTALTAGDCNRRDGLTDLAVTIKHGDTYRLLLFEGPQGALRSEPEVLQLAAESPSLSIGYFDADGYADLVVASGRKLLLMQGRDRKLSLSPEQRPLEQIELETLHTFDSNIRGLTFGDFSGTGKPDIAVLTEQGELYKGGSNDAADATAKVESRLPQWQSRLVASQLSAEKNLIAARLTSTPVDSLALIDTHNRELCMVTFRSESTNLNLTDESPLNIDSVTRLSAEEEITALWPMRLNSDALSDLVALKAFGNPLAFIETQAQTTFTVTNTGDSGAGSFRQAILNANANPGADVINFQIAGSGIPTISVLNPLPDLSEAVTIDGTTQSAGHVELRGDQIQYLEKPADGRTAIALRIKGGNSTVRGLVINRFLWRKEEGDSVLQAGGCIYLADHGSNIIEGNIIGSDPNVSQWLSANSSLLIYPNCPNNLIGGTTQQARNVIIGATQLLYDGGNVVQGNFIGTNLEGTAVVTGIDPKFGTLRTSSIGLDSPRNLLGGTVAGARNIIAGGVGMIDGLAGPGTPAYPHHIYSNLIQGNYIGTDVTGTKVLGGQVKIQDSPDNTIGGTTPAARNIISGSRRAGILVLSADDTSGGTLIQGNYIGTDKTGQLGLGNNLDGVSPQEANPFRPSRGGICIFIVEPLFEITRTGKNITIGGSIPEARNVISASLTHGLVITGTPSKTSGRIGVTVQGNAIGTDASGVNPLGNKADGIFIGSRAFQCKVENNIIAFNENNGVNIPEPSGDLPATKISLLNNSVYSNRSLGINLGSEGVTQNDLTDSDAGANESQNYPLLSGASLAAGALTLNGTLNSTPESTFTMQFYLGNNHEGHQLTGNLPILLLEKQVTTDKDGNASFAFTVTPPNHLTEGWVNATATSSAGNTSEFSDCVKMEISNCTYSFSQANQTFKAIGGTAMLNLTSGATCGWAVTSSAEWVKVLSGSQGQGNGVVNYSVAAYSGVASRTAVLTVGGQNFTITQLGTGPFISGISIQGKHLMITGENFDSGTQILVNGEPQKTLRDLADLTILTGKKLVKRIAPGQLVQIQVKNSNGVVSPVFPFTRPM
jgi:hypothetical protein